MPDTAHLVRVLPAAKCLRDYNLEILADVIFELLKLKYDKTGQALL